MLIAILSLWGAAAAYGGSFLPGVVRQTNGVYLIENHSTAALVWHQTGRRGATVVHLDAHDDCRFVPADKLKRLTPLWKAQAWEKIYRLSDLSFVSGFQVRPEDTLFDLGNFVYPCIADGTVARFIWVLPDLRLDEAARARLKGHLTAALKLDSPFFTDHEDGSFSFPLLGATVTVTTLDALKPVPAGAILDLDIDFFAFPRALTDIHLKGDLQWDPEAVCARLESLVAAPSVTTISASVYGGYLPLMLRFLADACFDRLATGAYPPYARQHLAAVLAMRRTAAPVPLPDPPHDPVYLPAYRYLAGLLKLMERQAEAALALMEEAAGASPAYRKSLLDAAEALRHMGAIDAAAESVRRFETLTGHATTESRTEQVHDLRALHRFEEAEAMARELTAWNPDPHLLMLHGGVLAEMERYVDAADVFRRILAIHPQDSLAAYNLGYVLEQQGALADAAVQYQLAVAVRPDFAAAHENLGHLMMLRKDFAAAESHLRRALELRPLEAATWGNLGFVLLETKHYAEAATALRKAIELDPTLDRAREGLSVALAAEQNTHAP